MAKSSNSLPLLYQVKVYPLVLGESFQGALSEEKQRRTSQIKMELPGLHWVSTPKDAKEISGPFYRVSYMQSEKLKTGIPDQELHVCPSMFLWWGFREEVVHKPLASVQLGSSQELWAGLTPGYPAKEPHWANLGGLGHLPANTGLLGGISDGLLTHLCAFQLFRGSLSAAGTSAGWTREPSSFQLPKSCSDTWSFSMQ